MSFLDNIILKHKISNNREEYTYHRDPSFSRGHNEPLSKKQGDEVEYTFFFSGRKSIITSAFLYWLCYIKAKKRCRLRSKEQSIHHTSPIIRFIQSNLKNEKWTDIDYDPIYQQIRETNSNKICMQVLNHQHY